MTPLGAELRKIRRDRKMRLYEHAKKVGVSAAYMSALEHGNRGTPTSQMLERIVSALDLESSQAERVKSLVKISRPNVMISTSNLSPLATEFVNRLAEKISHVSEDKLRTLIITLQA